MTLPNDMTDGLKQEPLTNLSLQNSSDSTPSLDLPLYSHLVVPEGEVVLRQLTIESNDEVSTAFNGNLKPGPQEYCANSFIHLTLHFRHMDESLTLTIPYTVYGVQYITPPLRRFSKLDCSTTKRVPIPNNTVS